jgi:ABC-type lipoprotein export system ATPase subunit
MIVVETHDPSAAVSAKRTIRLQNGLIACQKADETCVTVELSVVLRD